MKDAMGTDTTYIQSEITSDQMDNKDTKCNIRHETDENVDTKLVIDATKITPGSNIIIEEVSPITDEIKSVCDTDNHAKIDTSDVEKEEMDADMLDQYYSLHNSQSFDPNETDYGTDIVEMETDTGKVNSETATTSQDVQAESYAKPEGDKTSGDVENVDLTVSEQKSRIRKRPGNKRSRPIKRIRRGSGKRDQKGKTKASATTIKASAPVNNDCLPEVETSKDDVEYCLTVTNLPNSWSFMDIKNYIDTQCGPVDEIEMLKDDTTSNGAIRLSYQTESDCRIAMVKLKDKKITDKKLVVCMSVESLNLPDDNESQLEGAVVPELPVASESPAIHDLSLWELDPEGLYGLKYDFLRSLGITPPLDKWIHVTNFRCDRHDLRDILEMAGTVLMCTVFATQQKYAKVMYNHPLEAVQAVSMFNGQKIYGQVLKVMMDRIPENTILLPKGVSTIGPGLGALGRPLRNILNHYQRFVTNRTASINRHAFQIPKNLDQYPTTSKTEEVERFTVEKIEDFMYNRSMDQKKTATKIKSPATGSSVQASVKPVAGTPVAQKPVGEKPVAVKPPTIQTTAAKSQPPAQTPGPPLMNTMANRGFSPVNFQQRNFGPNFGLASRPFGPDHRMAGRPFALGQGQRPGPRPGWNGPGPMGPMGPMRPMRPMRPMAGPMMGPRPMPGSLPLPGLMGPMPAQMSGTMAGPGPVQAPMPGPRLGQVPGQMYTGNDPPVQLLLNNLPPSTTFSSLCEMMSACGHVVSIQLTTPGCATVAFANRLQAEICFQMYNNSFVENYMIHVKYA